MLKDHTEEELNQIARDLAGNRIFTSRHLSEPNLLGSVFLPLGLGALKDASEDELKNIGMVYEYLDKAGPRSINGYPMFFSCHLLSVADSDKVISKYEAICKATDAALKEGGS